MLDLVIFGIMAGLRVSRDVGGPHYGAWGPGHPGGLVPSHPHGAPRLRHSQAGHLGWLLRHSLPPGQNYDDNIYHISMYVCRVQDLFKDEFKLMLMGDFF